MYVRHAPGHVTAGTSFERHGGERLARIGLGPCDSGGHLYDSMALNGWKRLDAGVETEISTVR